MEKREGKPISKRHDWTRRDVRDLVYELLVWDGGRKIDRFIWNTSDKFREIVELLRLKFGMNYK